MSRPDHAAWLTPYLCVRNARQAIGFYQTVFAFTPHDTLDDDGMLMHVEMAYHGQVILMFAPEGAFGSTAKAPRSSGQPAPQNFYLYVDDVDAAYRRAIEAGGKSISAPRDEFWGDRFAQIEDLDGYRWSLARRTTPAA